MASLKWVAWIVTREFAKDVGPLMIIIPLNRRRLNKAGFFLSDNYLHGIFILCLRRKILIFSSHILIKRQNWVNFLNLVKSELNVRFSFWNLIYDSVRHCLWVWYAWNCENWWKIDTLMISKPKRYLKRYPARKGLKSISQCY